MKKTSYVIVNYTDDPYEVSKHRTREIANISLNALRRVGAGSDYRLIRRIRENGTTVDKVVK